MGNKIVSVQISNDGGQTWASGTICEPAELAYTSMPKKVGLQEWQVTVTFQQQKSRNLVKRLAARAIINAAFSS